MKFQASNTIKIGTGLIIIASIALIAGYKSFGGFSLGLGGLLLTYAAFKRFWQWLEQKYQE